jgi:hypothetical protein
MLMPHDQRNLLSEHHLLFSRLLARHRGQFVLAGICLAIGSILLALDVEGGELILGWAAIVAAVFGLPWLVLALVTYLRGIRRVCIYDEGLAWIVRGREEFHPWEEVRELFRQPAEVTLVFRKRSPLVLTDGLTGFPQLATLLDAIVTERLLPQLRQAMDEGGAYFGPIVLKKGGLRIHEREFTWEEVSEYVLDTGNVVIIPTRDDQPEEAAELQSIPNALVLLRLLEERGKGPKQAPG